MKTKDLNTIRIVPNVREEAKSQGFYDGRFRTRQIKDKKKESAKRWCRSITSDHTRV